MKAGRELDALIAEKVMGWKRSNADYSRLAWNTPDGIIAWEESSYGRFQPSVQIADAWLVVEKLRASGMNTGIYASDSGGMWVAYFDTQDNEYLVEADTAPLAICLAALKAVE